jgi:enoyl-CoA hydratase/carnithine racemase
VTTGASNASECFVRFEVRDRIATLTIDRPHRRNALTSAAYAGVRDAARRANADDAVDLIVVTGVGRDFAVGGDLDEGAAIIASGDPLAWHAFEDTMPYETLRQLDKPTVAAVNGTCLGGGLGIALCCDLIVTSDQARFGIPEARAGMSDPWGPELLSLRISRTHVNYLALTGDLISADVALAWGLVNSVVAGDALTAEVDRIANLLRRAAPDAQSAYKGYIRSRDVLTPAVEASRLLRRAAASAEYGRRDRPSPDTQPTVDNGTADGGH